MEHRITHCTVGRETALCLRLPDPGLILPKNRVQLPRQSPPAYSFGTRHRGRKTDNVPRKYHNVKRLGYFPLVVFLWKENLLYFWACEYYEREIIFTCSAECLFIT